MKLISSTFIYRYVAFADSSPANFAPVMLRM